MRNAMAKALKAMSKDRRHYQDLKKQYLKTPRNVKFNLLETK